MSTITPPATAWQWPADVLAFATQHQVQGYLDPLLQALQQLFPTARSLRVFLEDDPEIRDDWHIVFEVRVSSADVPDPRAATRTWHREFSQICRDPLCIFRFSLLRIDP
jgi:hypothetical protein